MNLPQTLFRVGLVLAALLLLVLAGIRIYNTATDRSGGLRRVLLLGASVGKLWDFPGWPGRMGRPDLYFEMFPAYRYDKSAALQEIFIRPKRTFHPTRRFLKSLLRPAARIPHVLILKECSGYFPGDPPRFRELMKTWIGLCREHNIRPVPTTVIPVTREHALQNPSRQSGVLEFNRWIRELADEEGLFCLDLEAALCTPDENRFLKDEFAAPDGLHLNREAYRILDEYLLSQLEGLLAQ